MASNAWVIYDEAVRGLGEAKFSLASSDTLKVALFLNTSNCADKALADAHYATLTDEHAEANGYLTGGVACVATWANASGVSTLDIANAVWNASGGSIAFRWAVLYDDTAGDKDLIAYCLVDNAPADVLAIDGKTLTLRINVSGVFAMSQT